jgi:hypothetical protein
VGLAAAVEVEVEETAVLLPLAEVAVLRVLQRVVLVSDTAWLSPEIFHQRPLVH